MSIIIVAFNRRDCLERCLTSLEQRVPESIPYEVIVVLNGTPPEIREFSCEAVTGLTLIVSEVNVGFAGACNVACRQAAGFYLALLNDDAEIEEGWLENLVRVAEAHPKAGAVGGAILFPDGSLQEAGSIIWNDGSTSPVGRGDRRIGPDSDFVREVDYCSACSLLVRRSTWAAAGGMDEDYFPAYYEDCDLCMRIRRLGQQVLYTPRARVRHYEGASSDSHFRTFLIRRNGVRFRRIWGRELMDREAPGPMSSAAIERANLHARRYPRRLLIIDDRLPDTRLGSGYSRMFDVLSAGAEDYSVSFWCSASPPSTNDMLRELGVRVVHGPLDSHLSTPEVLYDVILISRPHNFAGHAHIVRRRQPQAAVVYDAEALYHRRIERRLRLERDERVSALLAAECNRMRAIEASIRSCVQAVVAVTEPESAFFTSCPGECIVATITPELSWATPTTESFGDRASVVFAAGWLAGHDSPNGDGLLWFVTSVWPAVRSAVPWARLRVSGNAPVELRQQMVDPSIEFAETIQDIRDLYADARVAVAPLRYGAGLSIKAIEALKYGVPLVAAPLVGRDLEALAPGAAWTVDTPELFAQAVVTLLTDCNAWTRRRNAALSIARMWPASARSQWRAVLDAAQLARAAPLVA